jgi:hypothetical protein
VSISRPQFAERPGIRIIARDGAENLRIENGSLAGEKEFLFTIIPERAGKLVLDGFTFNFFNIDSGRYEIIKTADIPLDVAAGGSRTSELKLDEMDGAQKADFNVALIALILLVIAGAVSSVIIWERRRYRIISGKTAEKAPVRDESDKTRRDIYYRNMLSSIRKRDTELFMKSSENILNEIERHSRNGNNHTNPERISGVKSSLYRIKYGGCPISADEMDEIFREIREMYEDA